MFWKIRRPLLSLDPQRHVAFQWPGSAQQLNPQTLSTQLLEVEEQSWWQPTNMEIEAEKNGDMMNQNSIYWIYFEFIQKQAHHMSLKMDTVDLTHLAVLVPMGERIQRLEKMNVGDDSAIFGDGKQAWYGNNKECN
jgi:hypothetical protein